jgi:hypothetical protein
MIDACRPGLPAPACLRGPPGMIGGGRMRGGCPARSYRQSANNQLDEPPGVPRRASMLHGDDAVGWVSGTKAGFAASVAQASGSTPSACARGTPWPMGWMPGRRRRYQCELFLCSASTQWAWPAVRCRVPYTLRPERLSRILVPLSGEKVWVSRCRGNKQSIYQDEQRDAQMVGCRSLENSVLAPRVDDRQRGGGRC